MDIEFLVTSLVVVVAPGTGVLFTLAAGLTQGARAAVVAAVGCTLGIVPHIAAAIMGLAAVLHASAVAFTAVKIAGVLYLLYMAWGMLGERGPLTIKAEQKETARSTWRIIGAAVLVNVLNPKLSIFFLAFLPQFISPADPQPLTRMVELGAVFMALTLAVFIIYGIFAASVRRHVISRPSVVRWMRRTFAAAFVALGAKLALAAR